MLELLKHKVSEISPNMPFNFTGTIHKPSHFPINTERFEKGSFYFSMCWGNDIYGIKLFEKNDKIIIEVFSEYPISDKLLNEIKTELIFRFDMVSDLSGFIRLSQSEPILKYAEEKRRGMRPSCAYSLYELLCISLVLQNTQVSRSIKMIDIMLKTYGKKIKFDNKELYVFWQPHNLLKATEEELRALKIGYRAKSFLKVADFFTKTPDFEFTLRKISKNKASKELQKIYGIGPASTWYLLFENLHHYDAFDYISPWENKILSMLIYNVLDKPSADILNYAKEKWGDYRMLAVHYIFEDIFWKRKNKNIQWLNDLIRM